MMLPKLKITQSQRDNQKKTAKYAHVFATNKQITSAHKRGVATYTHKKKCRTHHKRLAKRPENARNVTRSRCCAVLCGVLCARCQVTQAKSGPPHVGRRSTSLAYTRLWRRRENGCCCAAHSMRLDAKALCIYN